jgi:hypothetical protein
MAAAVARTGHWTIEIVRRCDRHRFVVLLRRQLEEEGKPPPNYKRVWCVMKAHRLKLARHAGGAERHHDGRIAMPERNTRWCSDGFEIACANGERIRFGPSLEPVALGPHLRPRLLRPRSDELRRHHRRSLRR